MLGISLISGLALILGGCTWPNQSQSTTVKITPSIEATVASNTVDIKNFSFNPPTLKVKKGTVITWTNNDSVAHQINSTTFGSDALTTGQSYSFTFNDGGTFDYKCSIHPSMKGTIIVE